MNLPRYRVVLAAVAWFSALAWVFMMFVADWTAVNWVAAGALGALATGLTVPLVASGTFSFRFRVAWATALPSVAKQIFVDFWILTVTLCRSIARRRRSVGLFVARADFPVGGRDARGTAWRAFVSVASTWSPNSYVIDLNAETGNRLSHDLVPNRSSESPA